MYRIVVHRRAARYLKKLPPDQRNRVKSVLEQIIYWVDDRERIVFVDHIGQRGDIYK